MTTPFGKAVRHLRERKGVSQKEMAKALGVSPAYLSALEHGRRGMPSFEFLQRVAGYFNTFGTRRRNCSASPAFPTRAWSSIRAACRRNIRPSPTASQPKSAASRPRRSAASPAFWKKPAIRARNRRDPLISAVFEASRFGTGHKIPIVDPTGKAVIRRPSRIVRHS